MRLREEGHYTIKRVRELPRRGNYNWLYVIIGPKIDKAYRALPDGEWQEIRLGGDIEAPSIKVALGGVKTLGKYVNGETIPAFPTVQEQLKDIAREIINPDISNGPTFSVSLSNVSAQEVGTAYSATLTGHFDKGEILGDLDIDEIWQLSLKQADRSGDSTSYDLYGTNQLGNSIVVNKIITLGSNVFSGTVNFEEGPQPKNNAGDNFSTPLPAGSLSASVSVPGYYKYWIYSGALNSSPTTSVNIRAISNSNFIINKTFNVVVPQGDLEVTIYLKQTSNLVSVLYQESSNADITSNFNEDPNPITVNDASGAPITYKKLTQTIGGVGYTANATYIITITA